jgi:hypothetical protein
LYVDGRNGADLQSLLEALSQLHKENSLLMPLMQWLTTLGVTVSDSGVELAAIAEEINWWESPLEPSCLRILHELITLAHCTPEEQVQLALVLSVLDILDIEDIYLSPLAAGTDLRTLRLQEGQVIIFSEQGTSAGFVALANKLGKKLDSSQSIILKTAAKSKSGLTAYLFTFEAAKNDNVTVIQFQVDDMNPEILGYLQERAFEVGALDYFTTPIQMKKNRPGTLVTILCQPDVKDSFIDLILEETTSIGVRYHQETRSKAERHLISVVTPYGNVRVKISSWTDSRGKTCTQYSPEYEDCKELAHTTKVPLKRIYELALQQVNMTKKSNGGVYSGFPGQNG